VAIIMIIIIMIMTTAMAMPTTMAHATDVVAAGIIITIIQLVVLSKEKPLTSMVLFMMSDYPTATMTCSPRQQKKSPSMCPAPSRVLVTFVWPWLT
jgi:hypothetical protein